MRAQIFDAVGLSSVFVEKYFTGTATTIEGVGLAEVAEETVRRHATAYGDNPIYKHMLDVGGMYGLRLRGEEHAWTAENIANLQHAVRGAHAVVGKTRLAVVSTQGTQVALGQAVTVGSVVVTPIEVVEDSRCPINARCVWAGRLVVKTRIDGAGWRDTADLTLGEPWSTHNVVLALTSGEPGRMAGEGQETPKEAYRFTYEAR